MQKVIYSTRLLELSADLSMFIESIDSAQNIEAILPEICITKGLVTTADVVVHK